MLMGFGTGVDVGIIVEVAIMVGGKAVSVGAVVTTGEG
jgi:hypothetical protein